MDLTKYGLFHSLYSDLDKEDNFPKVKPLLAHYTSIRSLKSIVETNEIWFSNPLFMNDFEEIRYGLREGRRFFWDNDDIRDACGCDERVDLLEDYFDHYFKHFEDEVAFDIYAFCLSRHDKSDNDGLLSMWRGYGAQGNGVAIILDSSMLKEQKETPLIISKVDYASTPEREKWIKSKLKEFAKVLRCANLHNNELRLAAYALFERLKLFALTTKHRGFAEEQEWRVIYLPDRDVKKVIKPMLDYALNDKGVEPKLKLKLEPVEGIMPDGVRLDTLVNKIILGPAISGDLAQKSVIRMLEKQGKKNLAEKVKPSTIPFRPI